MSDQDPRRHYFGFFSNGATAGKRRKKALEKALDIRKFEIELYWKRATYFWTLIGASFAGYFALEQSNTSSDLTYIVASLGLIFSVAWYLVGRGSKFWQQNWELHVDLLEDETTGPLHKSVFNQEQDKFKFFKLMTPYAYSPSKINQLLGLVVIGVWLFLIFRNLAFGGWVCSGPRFWTVLVMSSITILSSILLATLGQTSKNDSPVTYTLQTRKFSEGGQIPIARKNRSRVRRSS